MEWIPILGKMDEIMPQVPPALAVLSWGYPRFEGQLVFTKAFRDVRLAAAARSASWGTCFKKGREESVVPLLRPAVSSTTSELPWLGRDTN